MAFLLDLDNALRLDDAVEVEPVFFRFGNERVATLVAPATLVAVVPVVAVAPVVPVVAVVPVTTVVAIVPVVFVVAIVAVVAILNRPPKSPLHDGDDLVVPACFHRSGVLRGCRSFFRLRSSLLWLRQRLTWFCPRGRSFLRSPSVCGNATCALACPNRLAWIRLWLETSRLACLWTLPWKPWKRAGLPARPKCCRPSLVFSACPNA